MAKTTNLPLNSSTDLPMTISGKEILMAATKKSVAKKSVAKKSVAKKSVAKKAVAKKAVAKKAVAKKPATKKAVAKKAVAKKPAAKKPAVKKAVAKKSPAVSRQGSKVVDLTSGIPEVPLRTSSPRSVSPQFVTDDNFVSPTVTPQEKSQKGNGLLWFAVLALVASIAYFISQQGATDSAQSASPSPTQVAQSESSPEATPEATASTSPMATSAPQVEKVTPTFLYTSTGIEISWKGEGVGAFSKVTLASSEDGGDFLIIANGGADARSFDVEKVDTVGKTVFRLTFTQDGGETVSSAPLTIRGRFAK